MIIEQAEVEDAKEILDMQKLAFQIQAEIYNDYNIPPLTENLEEIKRDFEKQVIFKASVDGKIVGSARGYMGQETCFIRRVAVHPDYQNQGIGTKLIKRIETHFSSANRFELFTGSKSKVNLYLYRKLGYREFKRKEDEKVTLIFLEKEV